MNAEFLFYTSFSAAVRDLHYDSLTGLYQLRARYYNPTNGRFLSRDAQSYNFSNPRELDRYLYTANNPINAVDPTGYQFFVEYAEADSTAGEEGAALEPVGEQFASEAETLIDDELWEALSQNAGDLGQEASRAIRAENLASQLMKEGLRSPNSQTLIRELNQLATYNPDADIVSLGRFPYYLEKATQEGYTYFNLPGNSYSILGKDLASVVKEQWMYTQMEAEKDFGFTLGGQGLGTNTGSEMEYNVLQEFVKKGNYAEIDSDIFDFIFEYISK